jgi:Spherulation-specific family 4
VENAEPVTRRVGRHRIADYLRGGNRATARTSRALGIMAAVRRGSESEKSTAGQPAPKSPGETPPDNRRAARRRLWRVSAVVVVILAAFVLYGRATLSAQSRATASLRLGVPAYVFPGQSPLVTLQTMTPSPGIVILNPDNGDAPFSAAWQSQADQLRARGIMVLGYVHTDDGTRPVADAEASIKNYLESSSGPPAVNGIFLDEMSTSCSAEPYYANLYNYIHTIDPSAFVAANPGTAVNVCYLQPGSMVANTFVTFEHDASTYMSGYQGNVVEANGQISSGAQYPATDFWHLIYGASSSQMPQIIALAEARHAGYAYVTDGNLPNPWDSVASYILAEAKAMAGQPPGR